MYAIFTGLHGTVAPVVADFFKHKGYTIIPYDRSKVSVDDILEIQTFLEEHHPDVICHFAMGSVTWTGILAKLCYDMNIKFMFASTVSVYDGAQQGPYTIDSIADADDDYGKYKRLSELEVIKYNKNAYILRLGWQIGHKPGSNNMIEFLSKQMETQGVIHASSFWYPSCSFIEDTAESIYDIIHHLKPSIYLLNSNQKYSFFDIVTQLIKVHPTFKVVDYPEFKQDYRMIDSRVNMRSLQNRFEDFNRLKI